MRRRAFCAATAAAGIVSSLGAPLPAASATQSQPKLFGVLDPFPVGSAQTEADIRKHLREFGYAEAEMLKIAVFGSKGQDALLPKLAVQLVAMRPNVILVYGDAAARAAQVATTRIPIVVLTNDPVGAGLVASLERPGGNVTGVTVLSPELDAKRLELLAALLPPRSAVMLLGDAVTSLQTRPALGSTAVALGLRPVETIVRTGEEIRDAMSKARGQGIAGVNVLAAGVLFGLSEDVIAATNMARLPAIFEWGFMADDGGLIGYGPLLDPLHRRLFDQAMGLLRGGRVADYPVEQPTRFELVLNARTAAAIGVALPGSLLLRADRVIR